MQIAKVTEQAEQKADESHIESDTELGGHYVIDVAPATKFAKAQQFSVTYTDPSGSEKIGNFTVKRLTIGEQATIGVTKAKFAQSLQVDSGTDQLLHMFAYLKHALMEKPEWFKPEDLFDDDLVLAVYRRCLSFEASFRKPVPAQGEGAST